MIIAIDGPAGSGKSTVAKAVAKRLGFTYLDSGAMYRCIALASVTQDRAPEVVAGEIKIELGEQVKLDGKDVTDQIRTPQISELTSKLAAVAEVRREMVGQQRRTMQTGNFVAEGRDIGTVVAPEAELKIFLTASEEIRAHRRADQLGLDYQKVLRDQHGRDERDMHRTESPLVAAKDAIEIDTSDLTLEQVIDKIHSLALQVA